MIQETAPILANHEVMPGAHLIWLEAPRIARAAAAGQFVMVRAAPDMVLRRPLSVHQVTGDRLAVLVQVVGRGTDWLGGRQIGESLDLFGPLGNGFTIDPAARRLLLAAGGIGIAPLARLAQAALGQGQEVTLLVGARTAPGVYPNYYLPQGIDFIVTTEDGSVGRRGKVTDILPEYTGQADQVFACGPVGMYRAIAGQSPDKPVQASLEVMLGCGFGTCYGCTIRTKGGLRQVCHDGPVFDLSEILWEEPAFQV